MSFLFHLNQPHRLWHTVSITQIETCRILKKVTIEDLVMHATSTPIERSITHEKSNFLVPDKRSQSSPANASVRQFRAREVCLVLVASAGSLIKQAGGACKASQEEPILPDEQGCIGNRSCSNQHSSDTKTLEKPEIIALVVTLGLIGLAVTLFVLLCKYKDKLPCVASNLEQAQPANNRSPQNEESPAISYTTSGDKQREQFVQALDEKLALHKLRQDKIESNV